MIKAIIIDDEIKSIGNLQYLLNTYSDKVKIVATANSALTAMREIEQHRPDMMFLDIQMPGISGLTLLEETRNTVRFPVFITAHRGYSIEAMHKGAFYYLMKPFDGEELKNCIERVLEKRGAVAENAALSRNLIELSVKSGIIYLRQEELIYVAASGSYTEFYMENNIRHVASKNLKYYSGKLDNDLFYRCHNSYMVNLNKVKQFNHQEGLFVEMNNGKKVSVSRRNRQEFLTLLKYF